MASSAAPLSAERWRWSGVRCKESELQQVGPSVVLRLSVMPCSELSGLIRLIKVGVWIERVKEHPSVLDLLLLQWRQQGQELVSGLVLSHCWQLTEALMR